MIIESFNSIKGIGKYNNDIFKIFDDACYVMDGASAIFNDNLFFKTSDLYEYMQLLKLNINNVDNINTNISNGIKKSNNSINNIKDYKEHELPTFTISAIKENKDYYELYLLCDCMISILYKNGKIENFEDHRFDLIKSKCRSEIANLDKKDLNKDAKLDAKRKIWRKYRKLANNYKSGYPVGSTNPCSINHGLIKKIDKKIVDKILLCSDGLYSMLGMPTDKNYFDKTILEKEITKHKNIDDLTYILINN